MKAMIGLILALASVPSVACDWDVSKRKDAMTDAVICTVSSDSANVAFYRHGDNRPNVAIDSAYSRPDLYIRVDDNEAVSMGDNAGARQAALDKLLPQLETGQRIRVKFSDYPNWQEGDAAICTLPAMLRECVQ